MTSLNTWCEFCCLIRWFGLKPIVLFFETFSHWAKTCLEFSPLLWSFGIKYLGFLFEALNIRYSLAICDVEFKVTWISGDMMFCLRRGFLSIRDFTDLTACGVRTECGLQIYNDFSHHQCSGKTLWHNTHYTSIRLVLVDIKSWKWNFFFYLCDISVTL